MYICEKRKTSEEIIRHSYIWCVCNGGRDGARDSLSGVSSVRRSFCALDEFLEFRIKCVMECCDSLINFMFRVCACLLLLHSFQAEMSSFALDFYH